MEEAAKSGSLDPRAGEIASRAFDLGEIPLSVVMVPRNHIVALRRHSSAEEIKQVLLEAGAIPEPGTRLPLEDGTVLEVQDAADAGVLHSVHPRT